MKLKHIPLFIGSFLLATSSYAAKLMSSSITLDGGTIAPRQKLTISTDKLVPGGSYFVVCKITDVNNKNNRVILSLGVTGPTEMPVPSTVFVNGTVIGQTPLQFALPQPDTRLQLDHINNSTPISILNLDQTDSVTISNCVAMAETVR